jgi:tRNA dimethylallyltransferase
MLDATTGTVPEAQAMRQMRDRAVAASRQLAKRQLTWLRSMPQRHVIQCDQTDVDAQWQSVLQQLSVL